VVNICRECTIRAFNIAAASSRPPYHFGRHLLVNERGVDWGMGCGELRRRAPVGVKLGNAGEREIWYNAHMATTEIKNVNIEARLASLKREVDNALHCGIDW